MGLASEDKGEAKERRGEERKRRRRRKFKKTLERKYLAHCAEKKRLVTHMCGTWEDDENHSRSSEAFGSLSTYVDKIPPQPRIKGGDWSCIFLPIFWAIRWPLFWRNLDRNQRGELANGWGEEKNKNEWIWRPKMASAKFLLSSPFKASYQVRKHDDEARVRRTRAWQAPFFFFSKTDFGSSSFFFSFSNESFN